MTHIDFEAFRARLGLNRKRLGAELGISQDWLRRMLKGEAPIPRHIALACSAIAQGFQPMGDSK